MITKPMLAVAAEDLSALKYPLLATPKLDGIRCLVIDGKALSRSLKPIPNKFIRETVERECPNGFDGELMVKGLDFNASQSKIMSHEGEPDFEYHVFDTVDVSGALSNEGLSEPYWRRMDKLRAFAGLTASRCRYVLPVEIANLEELNEFEAKCIAEGYEGVMVRTPYGPYKCGRSTLKEGYLLKVKRFEDSEAIVLGFEELLTNTNEKTTNELGQSERSGKKEGLVPADTLGALLVRDLKTGVEFGIGSGFTAAERKEIWHGRQHNLGRTVTYKHQPSGQKDKPRFPTFKGFRSQEDMSS